jgi:hypothetical protein
VSEAELHARLQRLERENASLRKLICSSEPCEHTWHGVTYDHQSTDTGYRISFEEECMKCLRRRPPAPIRMKYET